MRFLIVIILSLILFSCSTNVDNVSITQIESNYPIIIGLDSSKDSIEYIVFPLTFLISQSSFWEIHVDRCSCDYYYNSKYTRNGDWRGGVELWAKDNNNNLVLPTRENSLQDITRKEHEFVSYVYYGNLTKEAQALIHEQIKSIHIEANKDTIHWKSIQELKQTSSQFIKTFLQKDSIRFGFYFYGRYTKWKIAHKKLPVEVK